MAQGQKYTEGAEASVKRFCDWPECLLPGQFKAPRTRDTSAGLFWFCLEHVRQYNKNWDFFRDMSADEIERSRDNSQTWNRPTWPMGGTTPADRPMADPFEFAGQGPSFRARPSPGPLNRPLRFNDVRALRTMGLDENSTAGAVRKQYKRLVKMYHPDANGGDDSSSKRLQAVIEAYNHLSKHLPGRD